MQKSFIERVFPKPKRSLLPQYDEESVEASNSFHDLTPSRIDLQEHPTSPSASSRSPKSDSSRALRSAPLSASLVHHDDPFLPIDRAAKTLQANIQTFLDTQASSLSNRLTAATDIEDGASTAGSQTPTQSTPTPSRRSMTTSGVMPIRQPPSKKITLRSARKGLTKAMHEFALLREEELRVLRGERATRDSALSRVSEIEDRRQAVEHEIESLKRSNNASESAAALRGEAQTVQNEIQELENRLLELKIRQRHLNQQAERLQSSSQSRLSSYDGTLALIRKETRHFLRRPPVTHSLIGRSLGMDLQDVPDMYALNPDRRSLDMAREQWTSENAILDARVRDVEIERDALIEGERLWQESVARITEFERKLRDHLKIMSASQTSGQLDSAEWGKNSRLNVSKGKVPESSNDAVVDDLRSIIAFLEAQYSTAESQDWTLLVCALGAELEAFKQAEQILDPNPHVPDVNHQSNSEPSTFEATVSEPDDMENDEPDPFLLNSDQRNHDISENSSSSLGRFPPMNGTRRESSTSAGSNESLKATLKSFPSGTTRSQTLSQTESKDVGIRENGRARRGTDVKSESEDDDPGPDFLLSH